MEEKCYSLPAPLSALDPDYDFSLPVVNGQTIGAVTVISIQLAQIDNAGKIVFFGGYQLGSVFGAALFTPNSVLVKTCDNIEGHIVDPSDIFALNPSTGALAFVAKDENGVELLFLKQGQYPPKLLAKSGDRIDGLTLNAIDSVAINATGFIAFGATYYNSSGSAGKGIFSPGRLIASAGQTVGDDLLASIDPTYVDLSLTVAISVNIGGASNCLILATPKH